eukprot:CAMPEP_0174259972 /NCGR_PEP_ID=MMETSP0439-20130205/8727_1 /TAXON_ID=0 /ORGANISM="Stereomyxa ramosa, Strain Chinc5" /LENGTH=100 /DNA_ID=CAMNT_0015344069 /DNA_START=19 /DNA_END=321 /DNA_ORIENTATION=-
MSDCPRCGKKVYFAERIQALGRDYHKLCFKCKQCNNKMEPGKLLDREGEIYCTSCYHSLFTKGYGSNNWISSHVSSGAAGVTDENIAKGEKNVQYHSSTD